MKVKNYKIICICEDEKFIKEVNKHLEEGYILYGNPFMYGSCLAQAVVKEDVTPSWTELKKEVNDLATEINLNEQ